MFYRATGVEKTERKRHLRVGLNSGLVNPREKKLYKGFGRSDLGSLEDGCVIHQGEIFKII